MTQEEIAMKIADHDKSIEVLFASVEDNKEKIGAFEKIAISIERLATNMEHMSEEQERQGKRLERLEREPAEAYKHYKQIVFSCLATAVISGVVGAVLAMIFK